LKETEIETMTTTTNNKQNTTTMRDQADGWPLVWNLLLALVSGVGFIALVWWVVVATVGQ
jgi:hypothetical protein